MRAIQLTGFGGVENFKVGAMSLPAPAAGQVLVRVRATSVNPLDLQTRRGDYRDAITLPAVIGNDVSGEVVAVGADVSDWKVGDDVYYFAPIFQGLGAYAELHLAEARALARRPRGLTSAQAASLPLAASTAWAALHERAQLQAGETVVIHAGAGGVGSLAVQIARAAGARVIATGREQNHELVRSLGAEIMIDYRAADWVEAVRVATNGQGVEVIFDTVGGDTLTRSPGALAAGGRVVSIVDTARPQNLLAAWERNARYDFLFIAPDASRLAKITRLVETGALRPVVDSEFPLEAVAAAHARVEEGGLRGKVVLGGFRD